MKHEEEIALAQGYYKGVVARLTVRGGVDIKDGLTSAGLVPHWLPCGSDLFAGQIDFSFAQRGGRFFPKEIESIFGDLSKIANRGMRRPAAISPEITDLDFSGYIIVHGLKTRREAMLVSVGHPVIAILLSRIIDAEIAVSFKKPDLRKFCGYLYLNPEFDDLIVQRLTFRPSGRDQVENVSTSVVFGEDVFRSSFLADLSGEVDGGVRKCSPFDVKEEGDTLWKLDPVECRVKWDEVGEGFCLNVDRYGNFSAFLRGFADFESLVLALEKVNEVASCELVDANPMRKVNFDDE